MTLDIRPATLLPGIAVGEHGAAPTPAHLLSPGSLLLAHARPGYTFTLGEHQQMWGLLPKLGLADLVAATQRAGVLGAGGAGFPTERKLAAVGANRPGPVVVNGSEGESASGKDTVLLTHVPHLVLDGAVAAAQALGSRRVIVRIPASRSRVAQTLQRAIDERHDPKVRLMVSLGADTFIAGEASAVVSSLAGGPAVPQPTSKPPTIGRKAVMLSNVETFARIALAARGFTQGSSLITVSGAVATPGVLEVDPSTTIGAVLYRVGADPTLSALITGGWHGSWAVPDDSTLSLALNRTSLRAAGLHFGAGALVALPTDPCPVEVLLAISDYLLGEGAGQCAPCVLGMAAARRDLLLGDQVSDRVQGRGLCAHPTATIAALRSGQRLLATEIAAHAAGHCEVTR